MKTLTLLPHPRQIDLSDEQLVLPSVLRIQLPTAGGAELHAALQRLGPALRRHAGASAMVGAADPGHGADRQANIVMRLGAAAVTHPQGYALTIGATGVLLEAAGPAGAFYGACTLAQILEQSGPALPGCRIVDWPDFAARGVMLDVSRDKVPTMETLLALVDMLAGWKINQLQLYTEHTFAYRNHREVWAEASPLTAAEIQELDAFCRERFVELVPNQNSFGHMHRWLSQPRYAPLAEMQPGMTFQGLPVQEAFSLCPEDPACLELLAELYDELLPNFSSGMFNVGCDETFDLGRGRSKEQCERRGKGRVYLDFLLQIHRLASARGRTMQFWSDIIVQYPELIPELPRDAIALEWGYEAGHPWDARCRLYEQIKMPFYVCPGTSSWCSIAGRTSNALANLYEAAEHGLRHGAAGYLITDWGDHGHWQVLPISYLGFAVGAAASWALEANRDADVAQLVSLHAFGDPSGALGRVAYNLGNVYHSVGVEPENGSQLFWMLQRPFIRLSTVMGLTPSALLDTLQAIESALQPLGGARSHRPDAELVHAELVHAAHLMRHACWRGLLAVNGAGRPQEDLHRELAADMQAIMAEYRRLWLARNRPGGLTDSVARLQRVHDGYGTPQTLQTA